MDYKNKYIKYKSKYLNLKKNVGGDINQLKADILKLKEMPNIQNLYNFEIEDTNYILIGEYHGVLESDDINSFPKIYEKLLKGNYNLNNIEVFIESSINNQFIVGSKPISELKRNTSINILDSLRYLTLYKPVDDSFKTTFFDIRDNSHYSLKNLIYDLKSDDGKLNDKLDILHIFQIIDSIFLVTLDTYYPYMMKLVDIKKLKEEKDYRLINNYLLEIMDEIDKLYDKFTLIFDKFKVEKDDFFLYNYYSNESESLKFKKKYIDLLEEYLTFEVFSRITSQIINPLMLYQMLISDSKIKILYCGSNHSESVFNQFKNYELNNLKIYQSD